MQQGSDERRALEKRRINQRAFFRCNVMACDVLLSLCGRGGPGSGGRRVAGRVCVGGAPSAQERPRSAYALSLCGGQADRFPNRQTPTPNTQPQNTHQADPVAVLDACAFVARVLLKNGHALETLPMLSLAQFVASQVPYGLLE